MLTFDRTLALASAVFLVSLHVRPKPVALDLGWGPARAWSQNQEVNLVFGVFKF